MSDAYEAMGEFHDLFMTDVWGRLRPALTSAFGSADADSVLLVIGAGTGLGTRILAAATKAQVIAIEPSLTMRAVLLARVADDPGLAGRVSVLAGAAPAALDEVQGPIAGFVCAHMLGHLTAAERHATFTRLAAMLTPGGVGIITFPRSPSYGTDEAVEETTQIGWHRYVARFLRSPEGSTSASEYLVLDGDRIVRRETFPSTWNLHSHGRLRDELRDTGFILETLDDHVGMVRAAAT